MIQAIDRAAKVLELLQGARHLGITDLAAALTYYAVLALFPALLALSGIFAHDLPDNSVFVAAVAQAYQQLCERGARECVAALGGGL